MTKLDRPPASAASRTASLSISHQHKRNHFNTDSDAAYSHFGHASSTTKHEAKRSPTTELTLTRSLPTYDTNSSGSALHAITASNRDNCNAASHDIATGSTLTKYESPINPPLLPEVWDDYLPLLSTAATDSAFTTEPTQFPGSLLPTATLLTEQQQGKGWSHSSLRTLSRTPRTKSTRATGSASPTSSTQTRSPTQILNHKGKSVAIPRYIELAGFSNHLDERVSDSSSISSSPDSPDVSDYDPDSALSTPYSGPDFFYDTGATGSFGSIATPLTNARSTNRRIGGIGGIVVTARKEGTCHAIPNVAISSGIHRNLAGVSQLARHHGLAIIFSPDAVYGIPAIYLPTQHLQRIGTATQRGLYRMNMDQFSALCNDPQRRVHLTELPSGEAHQLLECQPAKSIRSNDQERTTHVLNVPSPTTHVTSPSSKAQRPTIVLITDHDEALPIADYKPNENAMLLHTRMGHASKKVMLKALQQGINLGVPITQNELMQANIFCKTCAETHITRKPYPRSKSKPHKTILGLIHSDTAGPRLPSVKHQDRNQHLTGQFKYWQVYVDDHSKYLWVNFLQRKKQLPRKMRHMRRIMELDARDSKHHPGPGLLPLTVQAYRTDNAGELTSKQATRKLLKALIDHERTVPNASSQNPHAECAIKLIQDMARSLLAEAKLPSNYWPFAIEVACYNINRLPCRTNVSNKSRYEMFYNSKPDYSRFKTFGAVVTKYLPISKRKHGDKQSPSGEGGDRHRLVGYPRKTKGYLVIDTKKEPYPMVFACRNIHLQEDTTQFPDMSSYSESDLDSDSDTTEDSLSTSSSDSSPTQSDTEEQFTDTEEQLTVSDPEPPSSSSDSDSNFEIFPMDISENDHSDDLLPLDPGYSTDESQVQILFDPNEERRLVKSERRDTVNKLARRHKCDARLLCRINHGVVNHSAPKEKLLPSHHLKYRTEIYLPNQKDINDFEQREQELAAAAPLSNSDSSDDSPDLPAEHEANQPESNDDPADPPEPNDDPADPPEPQESKSAPTSLDAQFSCDVTFTDAAPGHAHLDQPDQDLAHEAHYKQMAAAYAGTPCLAAHQSTEELLHLCLHEIRSTLAEAHQVHGTKECDRIVRRRKKHAFYLFECAAHAEEAHIVEALRHVPANSIPTPKNYKEAMKSEFQHFWNEAIAQELANLKAYGVYRFEPLPKGKRPINSRLIFKIKANQQGLVDRFKARLVVQGFRQRFGVDYLKTHASVCKMQTFRYQMAHATQNDLRHEIIDVKSAYLEAPMKMPVYINIPGHPAPPGQAARLITSLYGTKQAGHNWHQTIVPLLLKWGFKQSYADPCCFRHNYSPHDYCVLCLFVDDFSITSTRSSTKSRDMFFKRLTTKFKTSSADDNNVYIGIRCRQLAAHLRFLDQERFVVDLLHLYGFENLRPVATPCSGTHLSRDQCPIEQSEKDAMSKVPFRQILGSLRYLEQCTRPDISFALNRLSRYQVNPGQVHWKELKHLVRYVAATKSYGLMYGKDAYPQHRLLDHDLSGPLECFVDSDHGADRDTRRSCTGYIFFSRGGPISWRSRLQTSTAISTCEAEFMAASDAGCENIWLRRLISEFTNLSCTRMNGMLIAKDIAAPRLSSKFFDTEAPTMFYEDNIGCIKTSEDPVLHGRMKHIDIRYHKLKEFVKNRSAKLIYASTSRQIADANTKALSKAVFIPLRDCMVIDPFKTPSLVAQFDLKRFPSSTTPASTSPSNLPSKSKRAVDNPSYSLPTNNSSGKTTRPASQQ